MDIHTGKPNWIYQWEVYAAGNGSDLVVLGSRILLTFDAAKGSRSPRSALLEMSGETAQVNWKSPDLWSEFTTPVILDGYIYGCLGGPESGSASLRCIDLESGRLKWEQDLGGGRGKESISLMAADGKLIILNDQGTLYIAEANPDGYKEISSCDVFGGEQKKIRRFWTPPVLCNGRIYCRNYAGDLVCIDVSS